MSAMFRIAPVLLALAAVAAPLRAQMAAVDANPSPSDVPANREHIEDLTQTTLTSPKAPPSAEPGALSSASPPTISPPPSAASGGASALSPPITPSPVMPQCISSPIHQGFYLRLTSGPGLLSLTGNGPTGHASIKGLASSSIIAIGGSIVQGLALGAVLSSTSATAKFNGGPFVNETVTTEGKLVPASPKASGANSGLGLFVDWYPNPTGGWHTGALLGLGFTSVVNQADGSGSAGAGLNAGLLGGYDWVIGSQWSLGLALVTSGTTRAVLKESSHNREDTGYRLRAFSLGLAASVLYF